MGVHQHICLEPILLDYYDKHGHTPSVVAFLQNVPAEELNLIEKC